MPTVEDVDPPDAVKHSTPEAQLSDAVAQDIQLYSALAWEEADFQETEEFIRTKCQQPNRIVQLSWKGKVSGWYYLTLDADAKKAVEDHKGVKRIRIMKKTAEFCATPGDSS